MSNSKKLTLKEACLAMFEGKVVCSSSDTRYRYDEATDSILEHSGGHWFESCIDPGDAPHLYFYEEPKPELRVAKTLEEALRAKKIRIEWPEWFITRSRGINIAKTHFVNEDGSWSYEVINIIDFALRLPDASVTIVEE